MNRRGFISMLAGAAGAPLVPWRAIIEPIIFLPAAEIVIPGTVLTLEMIQRARAILARQVDITSNPPLIWDGSTGRVAYFRALPGNLAWADIEGPVQVYESSWPR